MGSKILVIDDEDLILKILGKFISKTFEANLSESAGTGREGVSKIKSNPSDYAACIIDYNLPDMECKEIVDEIKVLNPNIKIILSTGSSAGELVGTVGAHGSLQKPFSFDEFQKVLKELSIL